MMEKRIVLLIGAIAIMLSLTFQVPTMQEKTPNPKYAPVQVGSFSWENPTGPQFFETTKTDYGKMATRTGAIAIGFAALYFVIPPKKEEN